MIPGRSRCLVVGGVRKLGRQIALDLASTGAAVCITSRRRGKALRAAVADLRAAGAGTAAGTAGDVSDADGAARLVAEAAAALGGLDALVFAVSGPFAPHPPQDLSERDWDLSLDSIAKGFFFSACAAREHFMADSGVRSPEAARTGAEAGVIIAITDAMGLQPWSSFVAHGAAKAAQIHLVKQLARAWLGDGVRVCGIAPGPVDLADDDRREATLRAARRGEGERLVDPASVTQAVRFCLQATSVTGANVIVDAGSLLTS